MAKDRKLKPKDKYVRVCTEICPVVKQPGFPDGKHPGKLNSLETNTIGKELDTVRGIG